MNNMIKNLVKNGPTGVVSVLSAVAMLAVAGVANAASIVMTPNPASGNVGDPIVVDISGVGWVAGEAAFDAFGAPVLTSAGSTGGGLIVSWDNSIVNLSGGVTGGLNMTFPGSQDFAFDPDIAEAVFNRSDAGFQIELTAVILDLRRMIHFDPQVPQWLV